ncbi:MAG: acyl-CoA dehydrogenase family protein [Burkholderiales bacterium]|nr:acyl-CoA dehydrogenase family protein [Burkholderiales bacterium]
MDFSALILPDSAQALRAEVRAFLAGELASARIMPHLGHAQFDREFSRRIGSRGWIGMTWPKRYGGRERSYLERFVVTEEMLAVSAPCAAHWFGDRQCGPSLLRYGSEAQKARFLPAIARGESPFALGMSEPNSGSDLASVRTRADKVEGGWRVSGQKVWTSWAHVAEHFFCLCRTCADAGDRHLGLSQLIVDLRAPGVTIRPIRFMSGAHHFNEVFLDNVFVPDDMVLGEIGAGWRQVTSELALERSGPERFMTTFPLFVELVRRLGASTERRARQAIGQLSARMYALRRMSLAIAFEFSRALSDSAMRDLGTEASLVKDLGTFFERDITEAARLLVDVEPCPDAGDTFERYLAECIYTTPVGTIRGGTTQVLRTIIARKLTGAAAA